MEQMSVTPMSWSEGILRLLDQTRLPNEEVWQGVSVANPAFDVTLHALIEAIITERGVARAPYVDSLRALRQPVEARA